jgi:hypothetical protein
MTGSLQLRTDRQSERIPHINFWGILQPLVRGSSRRRGRHGVYPVRFWNGAQGDDIRDCSISLRLIEEVAMPFFNVGTRKRSPCIILLIVSAIIFPSCTITTPPIQQARPALHHYYFKVQDANEIPVDGVSITSTLYDHNERKIDTILNTDLEGKATFGVFGSPDANDAYQNAFETKCEYSAFKVGYLPEYGTAKITYLLTDLNARSHKGLDEASTTLTLYRAADLVSDAVAALADTAEMNAVLRYAENLHKLFNSRGITVPRHSVDIIVQEKMWYLSVALHTPNVMNIDVLDSAGIAKTFFELAGRETIELLREDSMRMNDMDGFSIAITGTKKHFNSPSDDPASVECRYYFNKNIFDVIQAADKNDKLLANCRVFLDGREISISR